MNAVIQTGGKQYTVAVGDKLKVEKLKAAEGDAIQFDRVLMIVDGENSRSGQPLLDEVVEATVVRQGRAGKIRVFKMKRRKGYRRTQGHRQSFTEVEITGIAGVKASSKPKPAKKAAAAPAPVVEEAAAAAPASTGNDKLTDINGIGPVIEKKLEEMGITTFKQIAEFDAAKIEEVDSKLNFKGRIEREEWVAQAKKLSS